MSKFINTLKTGLGFDGGGELGPRHSSLNSTPDDYEQAMFLPEEIYRSSTLVIRNNPLLSWAFSGTLGLAMLFLGTFVVFYTWFALWYIGLTTVALGLVFLFSAHADSFVFDARKGTFVFTSIGLFKREEEEHRLYEIHDVVLTELRDALGGNDYTLHLKLRSGKALTIYAGHLIGVAKMAKFRAKEQIIEFLLRSTADVRLQSSARDMRKRTMPHSSPMGAME